MNRDAGQQLPSWDDLRAGAGCPLDFPRPDYTEFSYFVRKLSVSSLYLNREQTYRGACTLVYDEGHVTRMGELSRAAWRVFGDDLFTAESAVVHALESDHVNVESLGNVIPHLHWHIIPRYKDDGRWGGPIWTTRADEMPKQRLAEEEYADLARQINEALDTFVANDVG